MYFSILWAFRIAASREINRLRRHCAVITEHFIQAIQYIVDLFDICFDFMVYYLCFDLRTDFSAALHVWSALGNYGFVTLAIEVSIAALVALLLPRTTGRAAKDNQDLVIEKDNGKTS